ncbi:MULTISPECIES: hypothetical protein [unclassified Mesorhizobium]|uniref:hypothetical protein n=1 Tax=unclassified Mesorhizobium TaxID=325217 RepID=UPI00112729BD|nr:MULTISPECIES: hypothetical protein [unclassified Mesorhizobium]TPK88894.1 hypothetical protein FJ548_11305 [Mesorhizobium sp. B2-4-17]TPL05812.1 hypothetical protein FJ938_14450 [Mesorhizobium sp. B2-4-14]
MNDLLLWASAVASGSDSTFKRKAAELLPALRGGPAAHYRAMWAFGSLAHCEFGPAAGGGWRMTPPALAAGDPAMPTTAILCGARSDALLASLVSAAGGKMSTTPLRGAPDLVRVEAVSAGELISLAREVGIPVQWNAPLAVLAAFRAPPPASFPETALPIGGWKVYRFSRSQMAWTASTAAEAGSAHRGLFRFSSDYGTRHIFRHGGTSREAPPAVAKFWVLGRHQRALRLDLSKGTASFPVTLRPPGLIDRALTICSGSLPSVAERQLVYTGVTAPVAAAVSAALRYIGEGAK